MFQFFKDADKYLYHYTSSATAIQFILPTSTLKAGQYIRTNDPKESKDWQFSAATAEGRDLDRYPLGPLSEEMSRALKAMTNVVCLSRDRVLTGDHTKDIYDRGFCKPRMWAQYADRHKGVCLIFNKKILERAMSRAFPASTVYAGPVSYLNRDIVPDLATSPYAINIDYLERLGKVEYCRKHVQVHHKRLFFEKCLDWRDEEEYRWVIMGTEEKDLYLNYENGLAGVVFGADCDENAIHGVTDLCRGKGLAYEQLVWKGCTPWYSWRSKW